MAKKGTKEIGMPKANFYIDITDQVCPITFVKTKLLIESMDAGDIAEIRLQGAEALENVPRSVEAHGHLILGLDPEEPNNVAVGPHRLIIRKI